MSNVQLPELGNKQGFDEATAQAFMDDARNRILSLGTNQTDLIGFTQEAMLGEQYAGLGDEYKSLVLQSLMNLRNQVVNLFTSLIRSIGDTTQRILSNIR